MKNGCSDTIPVAPYRPGVARDAVTLVNPDVVPVRSCEIAVHCRRSGSAVSLAVRIERQPVVALAAVPARRSAVEVLELDAAPVRGAVRAGVHGGADAVAAERLVEHRRV
jgi:hypothetical protein